ncbi:MAG: hypothetical protein J7501_13220, partial [Bdellovibrio sp.]|nr:hypothetical protein [Bdellovibrio sp.]
MTNSKSNYIQQWEPIFAQHRSFLISFLYRMTSSLSDSEDIVQDVLLSCADTDPVSIENPKSWLTKVCSNRALDFLKSAQKKREVYHGTWLPDAVPDSYEPLVMPSESPDKNILLADSLTTSFLLLIDRLTPEERA